MVTGSSTFLYVSVLVDSFAYAKKALERTKRASAQFERKGGSARTPAEFLSAISDFMYEVKVAGEEYRCAATLVQPFLKSPNEAIQTSAEDVSFVYTVQSKLDAQILAEMQALLNSPQGEGTGDRLARLTDIRVKKDNAWKMILLVGVGATHALVILPEKADEKLSRLSVTESERRELLQVIERVFGASVKQGLKAGQEALEGAGATIHQFLSNKAWKALDQK
jgi:hypothetical protein